jgi:hypothetical protein
MSTESTEADQLRDAAHDAFMAFYRGADSAEGEALCSTTARPRKGTAIRAGTMDRQFMPSDPRYS